MVIVEPIKPPRTQDPKEIEKFFKELCQRLSYISGSANPVTSSMLPRWPGDFYYETTAGDWWRSTGITAASWEQITFAAGTVGDHGSLTGLSDDDHPQYLKEKLSGGVASEIPTHTHADSATAGTISHSALTGLSTGDDHTQYLKEITPTTNLAVARWDGTSGANLKNSLATVSDAGQLYAPTAKIGGATHYSEIEADGTLKFNGDATVWDDIRITPGALDRPGGTDATWKNYTISGSGIGTAGLEFEINDWSSFTIQIPHGYKEGSDIYVHIHWTPGSRGNEENGNTVGWKIDYSWANRDAVFPTMSTADLSDACDGVDYAHQMTPDVQISGSGKTVSSMLLCNVKRTDTGTDDTWASSSSGALPFLIEIDFHYEIDTVGSRARTTK
jgi:hypothetical protein